MSRISATLAALLVLAAAYACRAESTAHTLVGQVLLPSGAGNRGVQLLLSVAEAENEPHTEWVLFDERGRFAHRFFGSLRSLKLTTGVGGAVQSIESGDIPKANQAGQIDVGVVDLREQLRRHRLVPRAAEGTPSGDVKVAMWVGVPHTGPQGEPVSLGSRQFPAVALGSEMEWLLSPEAESMYFLIERPADEGRGRQWRSGHQRLFGPFTFKNMPYELIMD